ncbi:hypothetical protein [Pedobacter sp. R20-19]|uniref:hypothetical protein n=1 Tax=Pedobacter sp. R20-19 TaxID=1270196 RepID=UPI0012FB7718|nr:hypothetical protein [Pedobacter sp. R20-19]
MNNKPNQVAVMLRHEASTGDGNLSINNRINWYLCLLTTPPRELMALRYIVLKRLYAMQALWSFSFSLYAFLL